MAKWQWAWAWKTIAKRWRRRALLLERDNDSQRAIASQVPYLKERIDALRIELEDVRADADYWRVQCMEVTEEKDERISELEEQLQMK